MTTTVFQKMDCAQIEQLVKTTVTDCTEFFIERGWVNKDWVCRVEILDTKSYRTPSRGGIVNGRPMIQLNLRPYINMKYGTLNEYASFARHPDIGTVDGSARQAVMALVMHELSHALQYSFLIFNRYKQNMFLKRHYGTIGHNAIEQFGTEKLASSARGHGALWKHIYKTLRDQFLNSEFNMPNVNTPKRPQTNITPSRADALKIIRDYLARDVKRSVIINKLVVEYGMKKTTASTYTYSAK